MAAFLQILSLLLSLYWLVYIARLVLDLLQAFARQWRPRGVMLVLAEFTYTITDPPLRAIRRVVPPLRIGGMQFDLAFLIVLLLLQILSAQVASLAVRLS